jgi:hypothetical protein
MHESFERFLGLIGTAASGVGGDYFQLPVADADSVYRERVYCYELYHQLRCIWGAFGFSLGGEIDKQGNPHFRGGPYERAVPDLLVHVPGDMERNLTVVEVKSVKGLGGAVDDFRKLQWFCDHAQYFRGVFLVYGDAGDRAHVASRLERVGNSVGLDPDRVKCLYHRRVGGGVESLWR